MSAKELTLNDRHKQRKLVEDGFVFGRRNGRSGLTYKTMTGPLRRACDIFSSCYYAGPEGLPSATQADALTYALNEAPLLYAKLNVGGYTDKGAKTYWEALTPGQHRLVVSFWLTGLGWANKRLEI